MIIFKGSLYAQLTVTDDKSQLYNNTQHPPFYGQYTGQPVLAGTSSKELENVAGAKFYRPHALADSNRRIRIRKKTLEFCSTVCYLHCLRAAKHKAALTYVSVPDDDVAVVQGHCQQTGAVGGG